MSRRINAPTWLTGKADAGSLPALLEGLGPRLDAATIDELYVFPTRRVQGVESTVFVFSLHEAEDRRRVITAHLRATRNKRGEPSIDAKLHEHATTPAERVPRVIDGVLKRLSEDFASTPPSHCRIDGSLERWHALIEQLTNIPKGQALPEELLADEVIADQASPAESDAPNAAEQSAADNGSAQSPHSPSAPNFP
jgi:hypothetical protein